MDSPDTSPTTTGRIPRREMYVPPPDFLDEDSEECDTLVTELKDDTTFDPACMDTAGPAPPRVARPWLGASVAVAGCAVAMGLGAMTLAAVGGALWLL